jgi:RNA polymerase sigma factor (sigma-70 family)
MRDSEIVAAIVAGEPAGLAEAYDKYAAGLFGYCRSVLREPADAADAVQDTYVIAASKLAELRDPERLRPWLYAVARNECHRRLRAGSVSSALDETADVIDLSANVSDVAEQAQLRDLVQAAIIGLNAGDQEVIELTLRHEMEGPDLADALGVPSNHAHALLSRARTQLEKSLAALLVARSGRQACLALDNVLSGWDGKMTVLMRKRVSRHIERCEVCGERKRHEMRPVMLLGLAPLAMIPAGLRDQVLSLGAAHTPEAVAQRAAIVDHAGAFGPQGFPVPLDPPKLSGWGSAHGNAAVGAGAAAAAAAVAVAVLVITAPHHAAPAARVGAGAAAGPTAGQPGIPLPAPPPGHGSHATATPPAAPGSPGANFVPTGPGGTGAAGALGAAGGAGGTGRGTGGAGSTGGGTGTGSGSGGGTGSGGGPGSGGSPGSGPPPTTPGAPSPPPPATPPPVRDGPVTVSPSLIVLASILGGPATGTLTLSASSTAPTQYAVTIPSSLIGKLSVSPSSGSIAAGQSAQVTVTLNGLLSVDTQITVTPGPHSVTVLLGVGLAAAIAPAPGPAAMWSPAAGQSRAAIQNPAAIPGLLEFPSPGGIPAPAELPSLADIPASA